MVDPDVPRVVVAGGGVAGLEACLALRSFLGEDELHIDLLCREERFEYRALAVLTPFDGAPVWSLALDRFAAHEDVDLVRDELASVEPDDRVALTGSGRELHYDKLLIAVGARPRAGLQGATTFRGQRDAAALRTALDDIDPGADATVAFVVPLGTFWSLPLYELAILSATRLRARAPKSRVVLVSPEQAPLEPFGDAASAAVRRVLAEHAIELVASARAVTVEAGELVLDDGRRLRADVAITLPDLVGRRIPGVPHDGAAFVPVDEHCRVAGISDVFGAGDITTFPLKQGGLATQQADAAAECILAELGFPIVPRPFTPVLRGVLYTGGDPTYLRAEHGSSSVPRSYSMWWPPSKIAGRHLGPYLALRAGAPRSPEVRPASDAIEVEVDVGRAVRAVANAVDPDAVPGG